MGAELERATRGRLRIRSYHSGQLGSEDDSIGLARFGAIDICRVNMAALNNAFPQTAILSLPYVFQSVAHMREVLDGPIGAQILGGFRRRGLVGLVFYDAGARCFYNTRRPIHQARDLRGLKIRVPNSDIFLRTAGAMGANATPLPFGATFSALQTHLIEGAENNWPTFESTRHFEVARYWSDTEHSYSPEALLMSARRFDALSPADRELVLATARRSVGVMRAAWDKTNAESRAKVLAAGVRFNAVDKASFRAAAQPVLARYLRDPALAELFRRIQAAA
jgi:tripartite ATP-independent transporter DctP family solute receptor